MNHSYDVWVSWKEILDPSTFESIKNAAFALAQEPGRLHSMQSDNAVTYYDRVGHGLGSDSWITYTSKFVMTLERRVVLWLDSGESIFCFAFAPRSADSSTVFWYMQNLIKDKHMVLSPHTIRLSDILAPASHLNLLIGGEVTSVEAGIALKNYTDAKDHGNRADSSIPSDGFESLMLNLRGQEATLYPNQLLLHAVPQIPDAEVHNWCKGIAHTFLDLITPFLEEERS